MPSSGLHGPLPQMFTSLIRTINDVRKLTKFQFGMFARVEESCMRQAERRVLASYHDTKSIKPHRARSLMQIESGIVSAGLRVSVMAPVAGMEQLFRCSRIVFPESEGLLSAFMMPDALNLKRSRKRPRTFCPSKNSPQKCNRNGTFLSRNRPRWSCMSFGNSRCQLSSA